MRLARRARCAGAAVLSLSAAVAAAQTANGPEFQVNTYTTSYQRMPKVAVDASLDFHGAVLT